MSLQLHRFSDASLAGYGCVIYLRTLYSDTSIDISLVAAKLHNTNSLSAYSPYIYPGLQLFQLDYSTAHPVVIPEKSHLALLLVRCPVSSCWLVHSDVYDDNVVLHSQAV